MKKMIAFLAALMLAFAACGDSGGGGDIGSIDSCDGLVDEALDMLQTVLDELSDLNLEDAIALGESGEEPEALADLEQRGEELEARATALNCSDEEMGAKLADRADELEADGPFAELILEGLQSDPDIFGN